MSAGFTPQPPDEAPDPLLAALRQQLGEGFGQAPPPAVWTGIRRQLAPRPWWRRPRYLLPGLAFLVSLSVVVGLWTTRPSALVARHTASNATPAPGRPAAPAPGVTSQQAASRSRPGFAAGRVPLAVAPDPAAATASSAAAGLPRATAGPAGTDRPTTAGRLPTAGHRGPAGYTTAALAKAAAPDRSTRLGATGESNRRAARKHDAAIVAVATRSRRRLTRPARPGSTPVDVASARRPRSLANPPAPTAASLVARAGRSHRPSNNPPIANPAANRHPADVGTVAVGLAATGRQRRARQPAPATLAAATITGRRTRPARIGQPTLPGSPATDSTRLGQQPASGLAGWAMPVAVGLLAERPVGLRVPGAALPAPLPVRPDSTPPRPPYRRWSVQVLAGPTLSYRTTPAVDNSAQPGPPILSSFGPTTRNFSSLERPALGWGAQAQVRRQLTGRWALALGLGYHEYATQLDLRVRTTDTLTRVVQQRDTYRLLTVPVQVSYALGPPRGRLGLALLAGAEPGWYRGGRTTEGSGCACEQQTFTQATGSPYNAWNVAFSLGFDLRYRLGPPSSRWQLLVQPTGRYVTTPFVRGTATGYVRRQPYSLGLLAGLAWDWR